MDKTFPAPTQNLFVWHLRCSQAGALDFDESRALKTRNRAMRVHVCLAFERIVSQKRKKDT
jgi:hypothetical protein